MKPHDYDWFSAEATKYFNSLTDKQLSKRIDVVRSQIPRALKAGDEAVMKFLQDQENAIVQARLRKFK